MKDTVIDEYQVLGDCQRDITGHLEMLKMREEDVLSEKELILLRAGKNIFIPLYICHWGAYWRDVHGWLNFVYGWVFSETPEVDFMVCQKHRDTFGIKWRGRKKICQVPEGVTSYRSKNHTGDRTISRNLSEEIFKRTGSLIPIGSGIQQYY